MAVVAAQTPCKPLAQWRTWWSGSDMPTRIAESIKNSIDPTKLPGNGRLVCLKGGDKVCKDDLEDFHTGKVLEGLLNAYPPNKEPSGYLLGDTVMKLNDLLGHTIFGPPRQNPLEEKARRDGALRQGSYLKLLLSYVRNSSARTEKGRSPSATYLKELALSKGRPDRKAKGSFRSPSPSPSTSTHSTISAVTLDLDGQPMTSSNGSARSSSNGIEKLADSKTPFWYLQVSCDTNFVYHIIYFHIISMLWVWVFNGAGIKPNKTQAHHILYIYLGTHCPAKDHTASHRRWMHWCCCTNLDAFGVIWIKLCGASVWSVSRKRNQVVYRTLAVFSHLDWIHPKKNKCVIVLLFLCVFKRSLKL